MDGQSQGQLDQQLQVTLAEREISGVLQEYCRAIDRQDWHTIAGCYHADAVHDHGLFRGSAADFLAYLAPQMKTMLWTSHFLGKTTFRWQGQTVRTESYAVAYHRMPSRKSGLADHTVWYRYLDEFRHDEESGWLIAERKLVYDASRIDPVERTWEFPEGTQLAQRDNTDASIAWLGFSESSVN